MKPLAAAVPTSVDRALLGARAARAPWSDTPLPERLAVVRRLRHRVADAPLELAATVRAAWRADPATTVTAEILPLLDACKFLEREATGLLAPRRLGRRGRPAWLFGSHVELRREPFGVVLVIGPANYPILIPGVQLLQALIAGNAVLVKPGRGGRAALLGLARALADAGLPPGLLHVLSEEVDDATAAIDAGVDKVVLTGSADTGRRVLSRLAPHVTPAVVELSGRDAAVVREDADLDLVARAVAFGMTLNGGFTCIAPRRVLVHRAVAAALERRLAPALAARPGVSLDPEVRRQLLELLDEATAGGARWVAGQRPANDECSPILLADVPPGAAIRGADLPAPVAVIDRVAGDDEAARRIAESPYRLGAAVFGRGPTAVRLARRLDVGLVVVNDMIVPSADPRVPFGGGGLSGFGRTRGAEGLLEMTASRTVVVRRGGMRPHLDPTGPGDLPLFENFIRTVHGRSLGGRLRALSRLVREGRRRSRR